MRKSAFIVGVAMVMLSAGASSAQSAAPETEATAPAVSAIPANEPAALPTIVVVSAPWGDPNAVPTLSTAPYSGFAPADALGFRRHARMRYRGGPVPPGFRLETRRQPGMIIGGTLIFAVAYAIPLGLGIAGGNPWYVIPVVPPIVQGIEWLVAAAGPCGGAYCPLGQTFVAVAGLLGIVDGFAQAGGIVLAAFGIARPRRWLVPDGSARSETRANRWSVLPGSSGTPVGLTVAASW